MNQLTPILIGKIKQGREHSGSELYAHRVNPIKGLANGQMIKNIRDALANQRLKIGKIAGRNRGRHCGPLLIMPGWIHCDEILNDDVRVFQLILGRCLGNRDPVSRGKDIMLGVHRLNQRMRTDRPIGAGGARFVKMDRRIATQPTEHRLPAILKIDLRIAYIDLTQRALIDFQRFGVDIHLSPPL